MVGIFNNVEGCKDEEMAVPKPQKLEGCVQASQGIQNYSSDPTPTSEILQAIV